MHPTSKLRLKSNYISQIRIHKNIHREAEHSILSYNSRNNHSLHKTTFRVSMTIYTISNEKNIPYSTGAELEV
jgi:uncharacterized protein (UPF0147 family)